MTAGSAIAHYRILSKLGEGGMGAVYRATDTRLNREVAIKVLPAAFAEDSARMQRFEREAQVLASLNHPNIAAIYGIEKGAIVMELVEGEDLRGPLPVDTAIAYARQIAAGLEAAHEKGIVHRDLKPANIKVTADGMVKLLDFGLAKAADETAKPAEANPTISPTLSLTMTQAGMILGTAGYMSPEQARGKPVDKRSDIWAFGVVLFELLTGKALFAHGETVTDIIAAVVTREPDWSLLPADTPPHVRRLLERCLRKDPKRRLRDIGEARILLDEPEPPAPTAGVQPAPPAVRSWLGWAVAGLVLLPAIPLAVVHFRETLPEAPLIRNVVLPPENAPFATPILSPDGHRLVFITHDKDGKDRLWLRQLDTLTAQSLTGTENVTFVFWSPDSKSVGFFADGKLKTTDFSGSTPFTVCECAPKSRGGTWSQEGSIVFQPIGSAGPLMKVAATGGAPAAMDAIGRWPWFLPDGRHFLFTSNNPPAIRIGSLDKGSKILLEVNSGAVYAQGYVLFLRDDTLVAQPFDLKKLAFTGDPAPVAQNIMIFGAFGRLGVFSASQTGLLVYQPAVSVDESLTWFDRNGNKLGEIGVPAEFSNFRLSPDGSLAAATIVTNHSFDVWLIDLARSLKTRFTSKNALGNITPVWSPDGSSIVYQIRAGKQAGLYRKATNMTDLEEYLYPTSENTTPTSWSPDGKYLLFHSIGADQQTSLQVLPLTGERKAVRVAEQSADAGGQFSPDGHSIAYGSLDSQRADVYIAPFPGPGARTQVSPGGGSMPLWRRDGKELFYISPDGKVMAAEVVLAGGRLQVGRVRALFDGHVRRYYEVTGDGQRFLIAVPREQTAPEPLVLVQNWQASLKK